MEEAEKKITDGGGKGGEGRDGGGRDGRGRE